MKKTSGLSSALAGLAFFCQALAANAAIFDLPNLTAQPNTTVNVIVTATDFDVTTGFNFDLAFDPAVIGYQGYSGNLPGLYTPNTDNVGAGTFGIIYEPQGATGTVNGEVLRLEFLTSSTAGISELNFLFPAPDGATFNDGQLEVVPEPVNVALGIFAGIGIVGTGVRRWLKARRN